MIIKTLFFTAGTIAALSSGYGALRVAAPEVSAQVDTLVRNNFLGWTPTSCTNNPLGCLESRYGKLQDLETSASASISSMRLSLQQIGGVADDQELQAEKNETFLEKGKSIYKNSQLTPGKPIDFAGRTYPDLATFQSQLRLLFEEKTMIDASVTSAKTLKQKLQASIDSLVLNRGRISLAKQMVPSQIELVRANQTLTSFGTNLAMIDGVIKGSEGSISDSENLIRSTKELMQGAEVDSNAPSVQNKSSNDAFDQFLRE